MPATPPRRPGRRPDPALRLLWQERLERFERSGLSAPVFCAGQRLSLPSFYAWRRRLRQPPAERAARPAVAPADAARLVPIRVLPAATPVELALPGGAVLRLAPGCDLDFVRALIDTLGERPC